MKLLETILPYTKIENDQRRRRRRRSRTHKMEKWLLIFLIIIACKCEILIKLLTAKSNIHNTSFQSIYHCYILYNRVNRKSVLIRSKYCILQKSEQPQLIWDDPLNLSILMRGGKETNKDFLSSGERKENSSALSYFIMFW